MLEINDMSQSELDPFATKWPHEREEFMQWRFKQEQVRIGGVLTMDEMIRTLAKMSR